MIYFISDSSYIKIGYSKDPYKRLKSLQTANPNILKFKYIFSGNIIDEKKLHKFFNHLQTESKNEWYNISDFHIENYFKNNDIAQAKHKAKLLNLKRESNSNIKIVDKKVGIVKEILSEIQNIISNKKHRISFKVLSNKYNISEKTLKYYIRSAKLQQQIYNYNQSF